MQSHEDTRAEAYMVIGSLATRLARSPVKEWRFDEEEATLVLDALLGQMELGRDQIQLRNASAQYQSLARKTKQLNHLNSWTGVVFSSLFFAAFMVEDKAHYAVIAGLWAIVAVVWSRCIEWGKKARKDRA